MIRNILQVVYTVHSSSLKKKWCTSSVLGTQVRCKSFNSEYLQFIVQANFPQELKDFLWFNTIK